MPRVIFMAFGTQGDVHPLAAVAAGLAQAKPNCSVFFVTHTAHENLVQVLSASDVSVVFVTSPPIVSVSPSASVADFYPHQLINSTHQHVNNMDGCTGMRCRSTIEDQHRQECLTAIGRILNRERNAGDLIIMNFFALEGWHLAELYKVPCAVAAPYVIPYRSSLKKKNLYIFLLDCLLDLEASLKGK
ncbi:hypothetical protein KP509_1Z237900 [Ceratopteris richardii]|nr:hypothetical protein KP509_1Z237900 [Ceratopteris richardii]